MGLGLLEAVRLFLDGSWQPVARCNRGRQVSHRQRNQCTQFASSTLNHPPKCPHDWGLGAYSLGVGWGQGYLRFSGIFPGAIDPLEPTNPIKWNFYRLVGGQLDYLYFPEYLYFNGGLYPRRGGRRRCWGRGQIG